MFIIFEAPVILNNPQLDKLPKQDQIAPQEILNLRSATILRERLMKGDMAAYEPYKQIQIQQIMKNKFSFHPGFIFKSFIQPSFVIDTKIFSVVEAFEIDLLMTGYMYSIFQSHKCIQNFGIIRQYYESQDLKILKSIDKCLQAYSNGYIEIQGLYMNAHECLKNLSLRKQMQEIELVPQFFISFKMQNNSYQIIVISLYEIMANVLFLEKLRYKDDNISIQSLCYGSQAKLQFIQKQEPLLPKRIIKYVQLTMQQNHYNFSKVYILNAIATQLLLRLMRSQQNNNATQIKVYQSYQHKDFQTILMEIMSLSEEIMSIEKENQIIYQIDEDYQDYFNETYLKYFKPFAQRFIILFSIIRCINVYQGIVKEKIIVKNDQIIACQLLDYFDCNQFCSNYII